MRRPPEEDSLWKVERLIAQHRGFLEIDRQLIDIDQPVVVVAHSYAGVPVCRATAPTSHLHHLPMALVRHRNHLRTSGVDISFNGNRPQLVDARVYDLPDEVPEIIVPSTMRSASPPSAAAHSPPHPTSG
jgi:hypothetical protein